MNEQGETRDRKGGHHNSIAHVMSMKMLIGTWLALMLLTWLTVSATFVDLGFWNLPVAMGIATVKALLVALFFMHLAYDRPINGVIFLVALVFVGLFVISVIGDSVRYQPSVETYSRMEAQP